MASDGWLNDDVLEMWTVYDSPRDFRGLFVARKWVVRRGQAEPEATGHVVVDASLEGVRRMLPAGLYRLARSEGDDATIIETWL